MIISILTILCSVLFAYVIALRKQVQELRTVLDTAKDKLTTVEKTVDDMLDSYSNPQKLLCRAGRHVWVRQTIAPKPALCLDRNQQYFLAQGVLLKTDGYGAIQTVGCGVEANKKGVTSLVNKIHIKRCQYCEHIVPSTIDRVSLQEFDPEVFHRTQQVLNDEAMSSVRLSL